MKDLDERKEGVCIFTEGPDEEYDEESKILRGMHDKLKIEDYEEFKEIEECLSLFAHAKMNTQYKVQGIMRSVLIASTLYKDHRLLQKMYKDCLITNREVVEKSKEKRFVAVSPGETFYMDLAQVLYDKAVEDPSVLDLFYENSKEIFSSQYKKYLKYKELYKKQGNWAHYYNENIADGYGIMLFFLCYENDSNIPYIDEMVRSQLQHDEDWIKTRRACFTSDEYEGLVVFNTGEDVLSSSQFKKYLKRKRGELAAYANNFFHVDHLTEENIGEFLKEHIIVETHSGEKVWLPLDNSFISTADAMGIVVAQNGGGVWFPSMIADDDFNYIDASHYQPNVDELINIHFKNCAVREFCSCKSNGEKFNKVRLIRDCNVLGIEEDFNAILYMYNMDIICKMFNQMKDEYYLNFSWGETDNREIEERYEARSKEMQDMVDALNQKLEDEKQKRIAIQEETDKSKQSEMNKLTSGYRKEIAANNKKLKEKDKEIAELKEQIALKDEYIELISAEEEPDIEEDVDITSIQHMRYLFVGRVEHVPELKRAFPDAVYMDTEQKSLTGIKVDAVVLLIKYMSHGMFYKVKNTASVAGLPFVFCNTRNINNIYKDMASAQYNVKDDVHSKNKTRETEEHKGKNG